MTTTDPFVAGATFKGGSRTVTDAEIAFLPALMGATHPLFHDEVTARASPMGGRVLYGPALLGIAVALTEHLLSARVMGLMEIQSVRFRRPVRPGDTVTATLSVTSIQPRTGKPGSLLTTQDAVTNQNGETVMTFSRLILVRTHAAVTP